MVVWALIGLLGLAIGFIAMCIGVGLMVMAALRSGE